MGVRFLCRLLAVLIVVLAVSVGGVFVYIGALKSAYPLDYKEQVIYYSNYYDLDSALVFSVVKVESGFREKAISNKGAMGLMQITNKTANYIALLKGDTTFDMLDGKQNIEYGCYYLRYLLDKFSDTKTTLCAYNAGEGNVRNWLKDKKYSSNGTTIEYIEYTETREYVKKIEKSLKIYKKLYGKLLDKQ